MHASQKAYLLLEKTKCTIVASDKRVAISGIEFTVYVLLCFLEHNIHVAVKTRQCACESKK